MKIKCIGTGSSGNCYFFENNENEILIVELGLNANEILGNLKTFDNVVGAIYTHNHSDHNYKMNKSKKRSSDYFRELGLEVIGISANGVAETMLGKKWKLGNFTITALPAIHDVECLSYLIECDNQVIMFATDTGELVRVKGKQIDTFIIEVNHIVRLMNEYIEKHMENEDIGMQAHHTFVRHLSLEKVCEYFNELEYLPKKIFTIHASKRAWYSEKEVVDELNVFAPTIAMRGGNEYVL